MVDLNQLCVAETLVERNKVRLSNFVSPKAKERDELYYWLLSRLEWLMVHSGLSSNISTFEVIAEQKKPGRVILEHKDSEYFPHFVSEEDFPYVLEEVVNLFNEVGHFTNYYTATCDLKKNRLKIAVTMSTFSS